MTILVLTRATGSLAAAVLASAALVAPAAAATWHAPVALGPWGTSSVGLVKLSDKSLVAAFTNYRDALIIRRSTDLGVSWQHGVRAGSALGIYHDVAGAGKYVDVVANVDGLEYSRSTNGAKSFGAGVLLAGAEAHVMHPAVGHSADGRVVVVWTTYNHDTDQPGPLYVRVSADDGGTFGPATIVEPVTGTGASATGRPSVAIGPNAIFIAYRTTTGRLHLRRSFDSGATWDRGVLLARRGAGSAEFAVDGDHVYAAFQGISRGVKSVRYVASHDDGSSWSEQILLSTLPSYGAHIAAKDGSLETVFVHSEAWWDHTVMYRHSADARHWTPAEVVPAASFLSGIVTVGARVLILYTEWNGGDVGRVSRAHVIAGKT